MRRTSIGLHRLAAAANARASISILSLLGAGSELTTGRGTRPTFSPASVVARNYATSVTSEAGLPVRTPSQEQWLRVSDHLRQNRYSLGVRAADQYPDAARVARTPLLAAPEWRLPAPIPLSGIRLEFRPQAPRPAVPDVASLAPLALPSRADGSRYLRYSDAIGELASPGHLREPPHLPAAGGGPGRRRSPAGLRARPVFRRGQRGRRGGLRVRGGRPGPDRPLRLPGRLRQPDQPERPLRRPGDLRADAQVRPDDGHRDVPHALPRPGPGRTRRRALPGDPGRHLPAVRRARNGTRPTTSTSGAACSASTPRSCSARPRSTGARTRRSTTPRGRWRGR